MDTCCDTAVKREAEGRPSDHRCCVAAMRVVFGHCPRDQVPDFTYYQPTRAATLLADMNYLLAATLAVSGIAILLWNKLLSEKLGSFYSQRFSATFGKLAHA